VVQNSKIDASESVHAYFTCMLRKHREAAGFTQASLAKELNYGESTIAAFETMHRTPPLAFAQDCDELFGLDGELVKLWKLMQRGGLPPWFRSYAQMESKAIRIRNFEVQVVPGLLQTPEYARTLLRNGRPLATEQEIDALASARLGRQEALARSDAPLYWAVIDESVPRRIIGSREVMREQIEHLIRVAQAQRVTIQVLPLDAEPHGALDGSFAVLSFQDGPDVGYIDGLGAGQLLQEPEVVAGCSLSFDLLRAVALPPKQSMARLANMIEDL
jgi:transcriptional regulator with XRE-family HTH domain